MVLFGTRTTTARLCLDTRVGIQDTRGGPTYLSLSMVNVHQDERQTVLGGGNICYLF